MSGIPIACTLTSNELEAHWGELLPELAARATAVVWSDHGVRMRFDGADPPLDLIARGTGRERRCCRFLRFQLTLEPELGPAHLEVTGPAGSGQFLRAAVTLDRAGTAPRQEVDVAPTAGAQHVESASHVDDLRYPIGPFRRPESLADAERGRAIEAIAATPSNMRAAVGGLTEAQLDTPYRPGGWTVRQVVHHVPDSHLNAYVRFKLALTEDQPTIKPYAEDRWARLPDSRDTPVETSMVLLERLHERWVILLRAMSPESFARTLHHPEMGVLNLDQLLALYEWHSAHHVAHVTRLRERMGW
jgi:hypothetical protein